MKIRSGGQTGVDRAALDAAIVTDFEVTGWCPGGRRAEDGIIPERYPLVETASADYAERTRLNVLDADATLILTLEPLAGGTLYSKRVAEEVKKPLLIVHPEKTNPSTVVTWLRKFGIEDLNVAGPRESECPGAYASAYSFICRVLTLLTQKSRT